MTSSDSLFRDKDGIELKFDNCQHKANAAQLDSDGDGKGMEKCFL